MLQNEEFMNELKWNQEFMLALEKEQQEKGSKVDDLVFTERLKHMGVSNFPTLLKDCHAIYFSIVFLCLIDVHFSLLIIHRNDLVRNLCN